MLSPDVEDFLEHHGVKGMKWGVRHDPGHEGQRAKTRKIMRLDRKFERKTHSLSTLMKIYDPAVKEVNNGELKRINNKPQYKNADFTKDSPLRQKYYAEHQKALIDALEKSAKKLGTNASGTRRYGILEYPNNSWEVVARDVQHAATAILTLKLNLDDTGHILSFEIVEPMVHDSLDEEEISDIDETLSHLGFSDEEIDEYFEHHGVKGMKWGVRRSGSVSSTDAKTRKLARPGTDITVRQKPGKFVTTSGGQRRVAAPDAVRTAAARQLAKKSTTDSLSNNQLKDAINRMQMEQQFSKLAKEIDRRNRGRKFIDGLVKNKKVRHYTVKAGKVVKTAAKTAAVAAA